MITVYGELEKRGRRDRINYSEVQLAGTKNNTKLIKMAANFRGTQESANSLNLSRSVRNLVPLVAGKCAPVWSTECVSR